MTTFPDFKQKYPQAIKKYGELQANEVFGFEPAYALGGKIEFKSIKK